MNFGVKEYATQDFFSFGSSQSHFLWMLAHGTGHDSILANVRVMVACVLL